MKPAPFEYHAPATTADAVALLAGLGDDAKVLAGGQSLVPMLALRLAVFAHLVDITRIAELRGIERTGRHALDRERDHRRRSRGQRRRRGRGPVAHEGHAVHRPLPDPQPRHARRIDRPRRSGRRVPGGGARPRRRASTSRRTTATAPSPPATSSPGSGAPRWSPTSCSCAWVSRFGARGVASPWRSSPAATATSRSRVRPSASISTATTASLAAASGSSASARCRSGLRAPGGRGHRTCPRRRRAGSGRPPGDAGARLDPGRCARLGPLPRSSGRGHGGPGVVGGSIGGARWLTLP